MVEPPSEIFDLLQHLADDDFDVLVVDRNALQAVDLLDLVDEIVGQRLDTEDGENVLRRGVPLEQVFALLQDVAFLDHQVLGLRHQIFHGLFALGFRHDADAALVLVVATEFHLAGDVGDDGVILRTTCFEQLGHARQTARDVAGRRATGLDTRERVAGTDFVAFSDRQDGVDRQEVTRLHAAGVLDRLTVVVDQHDGGLEFDLLRSRAGVDHHLVGDAGRFVGFVAGRDAFDQVFELHAAGEVGDDRGRERIPVGHALAALHLVAIAVAQAAAIDRLERLADAALGVDEFDLHRAAVDHDTYRRRV